MCDVGGRAHSHGTMKVCVLWVERRIVGEGVVGESAWDHETVCVVGGEAGGVGPWRGLRFVSITLRYDGYSGVKKVKTTYKAQEST